MCRIVRCPRRRWPMSGAMRTPRLPTTSRCSPILSIAAVSSVMSSQGGKARWRRCFLAVHSSGRRPISALGNDAIYQRGGGGGRAGVRDYAVQPFFSHPRNRRRNRWHHRRLVAAPSLRPCPICLYGRVRSVLGTGETKVRIVSVHGIRAFRSRTRDRAAGLPTRELRHDCVRQCGARDNGSQSGIASPPRVVGAGGASDPHRVDDPFRLVRHEHRPDRGVATFPRRPARGQSFVERCHLGFGSRRRWLRRSRGVAARRNGGRSSRLTCSGGAGFRHAHSSDVCGPAGG